MKGFSGTECYTYLQRVCVCGSSIYSACRRCRGILARTHRSRPLGSRCLRSHRSSCMSSQAPTVPPYTHCHSAHLHKHKNIPELEQSSHSRSRKHAPDSMEERRFSLRFCCCSLLHVLQLKCKMLGSDGLQFRFRAVCVNASLNYNLQTQLRTVCILNSTLHTCAGELHHHGSTNPSFTDWRTSVHL